MAYGLFVLLFLDAAYRVRHHPTLQVEKDCECQQDVATFLRRWRSCKLLAFCRRGTLTPGEFVASVLWWFPLFGPVPFMRVALFDHTTDQVFVGMWLGVALPS